MNCTIAAIILTTIPKVITLCTLYPVQLRIALVDATLVPSTLSGIIIANKTLPLQPFICSAKVCIINSTTITIPYGYYISFNASLIISTKDLWSSTTNTFTFKYTEATVTSCNEVCYTYTVIANYYLTFSFNKTCDVFVKPFSISVNCFTTETIHPIHSFLYIKPPKQIITKKEEKIVDIASLLSIIITLFMVFRAYQFEE